MQIENIYIEHCFITKVSQETKPLCLQKIREKKKRIKNKSKQRKNSSSVLFPKTGYYK